jgi:oxygen-dependent protoporphyrinogen oxidase
MSETVRIAVVGAGIAGLSTHYFLEREARRMGITAHVETWDPRPTPGGNVSTATGSGWQCEAAVESVLSSRRETMDLALDLGLGDRIVQASPLAKKRFIVWKGRPRSMGPASAIGAFPTWGAKLRALWEPFVPRGPEDESVADFGVRRLGRGLMQQIMDPMVTGIYAAAPERLSVRSAFPRIKTMEMAHGSLFAGMRAGAKACKALPPDERPASGSYTLRGGMAELVQTLAAKVSGHIHQERRILSISREGSRWALRTADGSQGAFDDVVLAVPAFDVARIQGLPAELIPDLEKLPYNAVTVVGLGFDRSQVAHPLDGFGFLVPKSEGRKILGTLFSSSLWPHAAPAGKVLLRTIVGGGRQPELAALPDDALVDMVRHELSELLGARGEPVYVHVARHARGIPEYPVGHAATIGRLKARLDGTHLHLAGNAWDGIGLNDCVTAALPRARDILEAARVTSLARGGL